MVSSGHTRTGRTVRHVHHRQLNIEEKGTENCTSLSHHICPDGINSPPSWGKSLTLSVCLSVVLCFGVVMPHKCLCLVNVFAF